MWGVFLVWSREVTSLEERRACLIFLNWFGECSHRLGPLVPLPMFFGEISVILYCYSQINQFPLTHWLIRLDILLFTLHPLNCENLTLSVIWYWYSSWRRGIIVILVLLVSFFCILVFMVFCSLQRRWFPLNWGRLVSSHLSPSSIAPPSTARRNNDDIYIIMQCLCVCHEKSSLPTSELSAGGAKWAACKRRNEIKKIMMIIKLMCDGFAPLEVKWKYHPSNSLLMSILALMLVFVAMVGFPWNPLTFHPVNWTSLQNLFVNTNANYCFPTI